MEKRWEHKSLPDKKAIDALSKAINVNVFLCAILLQRGITEFESAKSFFRPSLDDLHDPFLMKDMKEAVDRIHKAISENEKILVYGDYDVDGTTAVALVHSYLKSFYPNIDFYVPDRNQEGYGVSEAGIIWAEENNFKLIIALDLGIKASDMVKLASHKGMDFVICDHHLPGLDIPQAVAVLDPKREDCHYPFNELSGCGLGFKLMQAYARSYRNEKEVYSFLDLVAVSIASDIVPINGENRILAHWGLKKLNEAPLPGLKALREIAGIKNDLDISSIVFTLGPRINAAGRVAHAKAAIELLITQTDAEAYLLAEKVDVKNDLRREFDLSITEEAIAMIEGNDTIRNANSTVLFKETWHKGVIGIVAARCIEKFYRPTVILTESNGKITGSARSVKGFDLYEAISQCSDLLDKFGGHKYAAGITMNRENLELFQKRFEEVVSSTMTEELKKPVIEIDLSIPFDAIHTKFLSVLKQMAPFGPENPKPVFESSQVYVVNSLSGLKDKHVRFIAGQANNKSVFTAIGFDMIKFYEPLALGNPFRMAYTVEENIYNGTTSLQLRIKDIKFD